MVYIYVFCLAVGNALIKHERSPIIIISRGEFDSPFEIAMRISSLLMSAMECVTLPLLCARAHTLFVIVTFK